MFLTQFWVNDVDIGRNGREDEGLKTTDDRPRTTDHGLQTTDYGRRTNIQKTQQPSTLN